MPTLNATAKDFAFAVQRGPPGLGAGIVARPAAAALSGAMGNPWFRKLAGFGYRPIRWQGAAVLALMLAFFIPCAWLFLFHRQADGLDGWGAAVLGFAAVLAGHAVVLWKLERGPY